ncbi:hypothetical protein VOLCADRAFT_119852 [Volvox carteri f. nagariensis]|uniref:Uncharacterized protein n=1 Tax=Volvox carteri f. nagariensis TaxID=3068 RepID=D8UHH4_VOLCA|nr:uncharacterized protein VOLCADRAFT_119852 [Volvox carteri f. nagariensis]EFJ40826.1 hypothetical protein VOLCADRAFT_119852 [Volvox carteri f. nagariensis]|eukprot:XP_002958095.1 hypothetical protein VOLCADRAFT_119852 [Volvox carteri f. nagariensis]
MQQNTDQLHRMDPKLNEIDTAELSLKRLQEEVAKAISDVAAVKVALETIQQANTTAQLTQAVTEQGQNLKALSSQLEEVRKSGKEAVEGLGLQLASVETNVSKLATKLDSHNSALKTLADQLELHQNSTLSALQQQTAAVSEALEAHKALQERVDSLRLSAAAGPGSDGKEGTATSTSAVTAAASSGGTEAGSAAGPAGTETGLAAGNVSAPRRNALNKTDANTTTSSNSTTAPGPGSQQLAAATDVGSGGGVSNWTAASGAADRAEDISQSGPKAPVANATGGAAGSQTPSITAASMEQDDHLVREHTALTLDEEAEGKTAAKTDTSSSGSSGSSSGGANSTAASSTQGAGATTTVASPLQYSNSNIWTGWSGPTAANSDASAAGSNTTAGATQADTAASTSTTSGGSQGAVTPMAADTVEAVVNGSASAATSSTSTWAEKVTEGTVATGATQGTAASNGTAALDELHALVGTTTTANTSSDDTSAAGGSTGTGDSSAGRGEADVASAGGAGATGGGASGAEDVTGAEKQVDGRMDKELARRGHGEAEQGQMKQSAGSQVGGGRSRFSRMHDHFTKQQRLGQQSGAGASGVERNSKVDSAGTDSTGFTKDKAIAGFEAADGEGNGVTGGGTRAEEEQSAAR